MLWTFEKYSGCGNDFILFDNRENLFPGNNRDLIKTLCDRRKGIGADGILLRENSTIADAKMRIFNSDGSEAEMCGNGLRCFVKAFHRGSCKIEVNHRILSCKAEQEVSIGMGIPSNLEWNIPFPFENQSLILHHLNTGVPHTLLFVPNIEEVNVKTIGASIRHAWKPNGTNVTFVQQIDRQKYKIRTYERGVEGETPACGTGATAAALGAATLYQAQSPIIIETLLNEHLTIHFLINNGQFSEVSLVGPAQFLFRGVIELSF